MDRNNAHLLSVAVRVDGLELILHYGRCVLDNSWGTRAHHCRLAAQFLQETADERVSQLCLPPSVDAGKATRRPVKARRVASAATDFVFAILFGRF